MSGILTRIAIATGAAFFALILIAAAIVFLFIALYLWIVTLTLSPALAALIVGAVALVLAGLSLLIARGAGGGRGVRVKRGQLWAADAASDVGARLAEEAVWLAQAHPYRALLIALGIGFVAGVSPELRRLFTGGFRRPEP